MEVAYYFVDPCLCRQFPKLRCPHNHIHHSGLLSDSGHGERERKHWMEKEGKTSVYVEEKVQQVQTTLYLFFSFPVM